jgi:hypothetical protein
LESCNNTNWNASKRLCKSLHQQGTTRQSRDDKSKFAEKRQIRHLLFIDLLQYPSNIRPIMIGVVPSVVMLLLIATTVAQSQNTSNNNDSVILPTSNSTSSNGERQPQPCGDAACMHGGTCTTVSGIAGDEPLCDCSAATFTHNHTTHSYAGRYCEHAATVVCTSNDATNGHEFFCTNGGTCKGGTYVVKEKAWLLGWLKDMASLVVFRSLTLELYFVFAVLLDAIVRSALWDPFVNLKMKI